MLDLAKTRKDKGLTQEELAEKVGVTRQTISSAERGISQLSVTNARAVAEVLGVKWHELFN